MSSLIWRGKKDRDIGYPEGQTGITSSIRLQLCKLVSTCSAVTLRPIVIELQCSWQTWNHKAQHIRLTLYSHKVQRIRLTVTWRQSPTHQTDGRTTTKPNVSDWQSRDHKAQHIRLTVIRPQSPTYQTDSRVTTKPNTSDWQSYDHKVRRIRLTVVWPQSPTHQTDSRTATKSDVSDWQSRDHKAQHIRLTVIRPQSTTYQTDGHKTRKPNISDWWSHDHKPNTNGPATKRKKSNRHSHNHNWQHIQLGINQKLGTLVTCHMGSSTDITQYRGRAHKYFIGLPNMCWRLALLPNALTGKRTYYDGVLAYLSK